MTDTKEYIKNLYTDLAHKLMPEADSGSSTEHLEYSEMCEDVSRAVLLLSFVYRPAFKERFEEVLPILLRAKGNPDLFVQCFAEEFNGKHSELTFLIVCSFISEIFIFLKRLNSESKQYYIEKTTEALNISFENIFEKVFWRDGFTSIQKAASKLVGAYPFMKPFMDYETDNCRIADKLATYIFAHENPNQPTNDAAPQDMLSVNNPPVPGYSQVQVPESINVIEVPIVGADGSLTNQTAYIATNLVCAPVIPISPGAIENDPQLQYTLVPRDPHEAVTFQNKIFQIVPNLYQVVEIAGVSNTESHDQENITARSSENEKATDIGLKEPRTADNTIISEQGTDADKQLWNENLNLSSKTAPVDEENDNGGTSGTLWKENVPEIETPSKEIAEIETFSKVIICDPEIENLKKEMGTYLEIEAFSKEKVNDPKIETFSNETVNNPETETFSKDEKENYPEIKTFSEEIVNDPEIETFSNEEKVNDPEGETFSDDETLYFPEVETFSEDEIKDPDIEAFYKEIVNDPKIEALLKEYKDPEMDKFLKEYKVNNPEIETFLEEIINDPEIETFSKREKVNDPEIEMFSEEMVHPDIETFLIKENTLSGRHLVHFPENQVEASCHEQSTTALKDLNRNETVSSRRSDAEQANEIEINFQIDENDLSAKIVHLHLGGTKYVVRMPADMPFIFEYNGRDKASNH